MSFPYSSIGSWTRRRALLTPERVAIRIDDTDVTYAELDARAARCANALTAAGIGPGDRVAAYLDTGLEYIDLLFGCARIGAILVPLSTRLAAPELAYMIEDSGAALLVYEGSRSETVKDFLPRTSVRAVFAVGEADHPAYDAAVAAVDPDSEPADIGPDEVLAIFYTSGTTGKPKGAMLTHGNFFWTNLNMLVSSGYQQDERSLVVLPLFHVGGWNVNTLAVWWVGGTVVLERSFDAARALRLIAEQRVTSMMGVPTIYQMMADAPAFESADLSSVRTFVCGGAPLPVSLIERYQRRGVRFVQGYGLTEAAPNCLILPHEDAVRKAGAAGRPYFFTDVRVVDAAGRPVPAGGTGEVIVRGPSVMKGYWRKPDETAEALRGGWLHTGDVGRIDDEGYVWIVDRVKDMFISGGENVYPAEIESVLHAHPAVAEAAVIGVSDPSWGEVGRAIIVLRAGASVTAEQLRTFCSEQLARFKVPASVVFADTLPRNATGKLLKQELRERFGASA